MIDRFNPSDMAPPFTRYSQGAEIPPNAHTVIVGGQVGVRPDGSMSKDMAEQTEQAFRNIETVLRAKGMELEDLFQTRTYIVDHGDLADYRKGRAAAFAKCNPMPEPAVALLIVSALAQPLWKIEICAIGAKVKSDIGQP